MPWREVSTMSQRREFVMLADRGDTNMRALCRRFGISAKTGYKWLRRYQRWREDGLRDRSRKPSLSPTQTLPEVEQAVVRVRDDHPAWGGRKIAARLIGDGVIAVPQPSTITGILRRYGRLR